MTPSYKLVGPPPDFSLSRRGWPDRTLKKRRVSGCRSTFIPHPFWLCPAQAISSSGCLPSNPAPWGVGSVYSSVSLACPFSLVLLSSEGGHWALPEDQHAWPCSVKALEPTCPQGDSWPQFPPSTASLLILSRCSGSTPC